MELRPADKVNTVSVEQQQLRTVVFIFCFKQEQEGFAGISMFFFVLRVAKLTGRFLDFGQNETFQSPKNVGNYNEHFHLYKQKQMDSYFKSFVINISPNLLCRLTRLLVNLTVNDHH